MEKIVSVGEMQAIEKEANEKNLSYVQMMENAGAELARNIDVAYSHIADRSVIALVGSGNNGGDALVALTCLANLGWRCSAYLVRPRQDGDPLIERMRLSGGSIYYYDRAAGFSELLHLLAEYTVLIDGILGTGLRLPIQSDIAALLGCVRRFTADHQDSLHVVAVDCPSGVDCDCGLAADETIPSELTVSMAAVKRGLLNFPAADLIGRLSVASIGDLSGIDAWNRVNCWVADSVYVTQILPIRPRYAHKGTFGTSLIVAGSINYTGAALLAGEAAYRVGAGLVQMAVPLPLHQAIASRIPEAVWIPLPHQDGFISAGAAGLVVQNLKHATSLLVGPGFGLRNTTRDFIELLLIKRDAAIEIPRLVIDADGLKLLCDLPDWSRRLPALSVLTPHPGEMAIMSGLSIAQVQANRIDVARKYAEIWGQVVVLKGANTVIASPDGMTVVVPVATAALARAGTGDVLAGLIVGLLAQGVSPFGAAVAGVWIHARSGLVAEAQVGTASVLAGDLVRVISSVLLELKQ